MRKLYSLTVIMLAFALALAGCGGGNAAPGNGASGTDGEKGASAKKVVLLTNTSWPEDNYITQSLKDFNEKVKEYSGGNVELNINSGGALGFEGPELLSAVRDNLVPVSEFVANTVAGDEPFFGFASLPFLVKNFEEGKLLNEIARPYYDKVAEEKWNQKILFVDPWPASGFWLKKETNALSDFKGIKMRTIDENGSKVVQAMGGTPYQLPFSELYSALSTGVVDAVMTSTPTAVDAKFWEVLDYYVPASVTMGVSFVTINLNEFNKLDPSSREALIQAGQEMDEIMWERVAQIDSDMEATANDNGIATIELSDEVMDEFSAITETIRQEFIKNVRGEAQEAINEILEQFQAEVTNS